MSYFIGESRPRPYLWQFLSAAGLLYGYIFLASFLFGNVEESGDLLFYIPFRTFSFIGWPFLFSWSITLFFVQGAMARAFPRLRGNKPFIVLTLVTVVCFDIFYFHASLFSFPNFIMLVGIIVFWLGTRLRSRLAAWTIVGLSVVGWLSLMVLPHIW
ncbi:hypothetical protein [Parageobacillus toebii]|uniref:hypothetical protein n=1 Tax=Parageobacillus toebii TaxID=153151 RepID=UPI002E1DB800|nr:hypothetical protein [Parageobacillus toebii]